MSYCRDSCRHWDQRDPFVVVECCNTPDVIYLICTPTLAVSGTKLFYFLVVGCLSPCFFPLSCISNHVIMCIAFAYVFVSCIRAFSPLSILHSGTPMSSGIPFCLFSCARVKRSRTWTETCQAALVHYR